MATKRSRNFCFTYFLCHTEEDVNEYYQSLVDKDTVTYLAYGKEVCPSTGRDHLQGYVRFREKLSLKQAAKTLNKAHVEIMRGTLSDSEAYCSKESQLISFGTKPSQGKRTDLEELAKKVRNGELTCQHIRESEPMSYHQYGRTLDKIQSDFHFTQSRTEKTQGYWYWGDTGSGKSRKAFEGFHPSTHYVKNVDDNQWWDGYTGQETVILDDFRGQLHYSTLLRLADHYPTTVPVRCQQPVPFLAKRLIITSALPPEDVYNNLAAKDDLAQLRRRFEITHFSLPFST